MAEVGSANEPKHDDHAGDSFAELDQLDSSGSGGRAGSAHVLHVPELFGVPPDSAGHFLPGPAQHSE
jgi:hypothetical protein